MEKTERNVTILVEQSSLIELINQNLFSDDTERFFNSCEFSSERMAFMQGMNYAALLCGSNKIEKYFVHIKEYKAKYVKQGKWLINCDGYYPYCSNCKSEPTGGIMTDFCPVCGADMRGDDK